MKITIIIGCLCITIIIVSALALGYNGVLAGAGLSIIAGLTGWEAKVIKDKIKGGKQ